MQDVSLKAALSKPITHQIGGHLALDFCNTAGEHLADHPDEMFLDWETFIRWTAQVGLIAPETYSELFRHPSPISKILQLREAIYRVGLTIARGDRISPSHLLTIHSQAAASKPTIVNGRHGLRWQPVPSRASAQLRALLASEALSLFCSPRSSRIGICEGGQCGWLFLDDSRGKRRRWCDMKDCGNRAKARRYYLQQHPGK
ncbi:MAG TPA: CGNR zinc finger domain-containing protein [Edaphobacter sp.]